MDRRKFLKYTGLAGGTLALGGIASAGYMAGADKDGHTGFGRTYYGKDQFFNRKPFLVEKPTYEITGPAKRVQYIENLFRLNGPAILIAVMAVVLVLSLVISRPWCHFLCPLDGVFACLRLMNRSIKNLWKK